jgi:hypothetical protein
MKGLIALDIDGTITATHHAIEKEVVDFLHQLHNEGWILSFITGRSFQWGYDTLQYLDFPYYFAVQNGAILLKMPSREILLKKYLDRSIFPKLEAICMSEPTDFVIYGGYEQQDRCYYRPDHFDPTTMQYVQKRFTKLGESWTPLESYDALPIDLFSSVKCIAPRESAERISAKMESLLNLHAPLVQDPFSEEYSVVQGTRGDVDKGHAVTDLVNLLKIKGPIIVAGDDNNDIPMFAVADVKVVMATARPEIQKLATLIAPPATERGIIQGLKQALEYVSKHH